MRTNKYLFSTYLLLILAYSLPVHLYSQTGIYKNSNHWGKTGLTVSQQKNNEILLTYSMDDFRIFNEKINGEDLHQIALKSYFLPNNEGNPNLPGKGYYLAIPNDARASVEILSCEKETIQGVEMAPAPHIPFEDEPENLYYKKNEVIYSLDAFYPENPVTVSENTQLRGVNVVMLGITPFQYNPVSKELVSYKNIKIRVNIEGGNGQYGENRLRNRWWDPIIKSTILNSSVLPEIDFDKRVQEYASKDTEGYEYLIITPNNDEFIKWADSIRLFRTKQGIPTGVVTLGEIGGNDINLIENYVDSIYENWSTPPAAILLLGDYGASDQFKILSPIYDSYCVSDNIYADVTGNHLPDIVFARIAAHNVSQVATMVRKFIEYESNPPTNPDFYNHPITALGWQTERWFQVCSEAIGGFWKNNLGKDLVRINAVYEGNPNVDPWSSAPNTSNVINYFGPAGLGYLTETPAEIGGFYNGTYQDVVNAINGGAFMLQHRDHGNVNGWGEPAFTNGKIDYLTNTDLTYIFSINCLTGKYNHSSQVFAEKLHRYTKNGNLSGALGVMAASEVSYSYVNDAYVWGMYDYMWPEFMPDYGGDVPAIRNVLPGFANAYGKYFLHQSGWPYNTSNKEVTYNLFHHHGGAFLNVYTEEPQELDVEHPNEVVAGTTISWELKADEGALIALSKDGELIATATGTGEPIVLETDFIYPGSEIDIVVTKQNYFRYENTIAVIFPEGPYVIKNDFSLSDHAGNANGMADFNELISFDIVMENVGNVVAEDVEVRIQDGNEYFELIEASADFGDIAPSQFVENQEAFTLKVANDVPDQYEAELMLVAENDVGEWESHLNFTVNAPVLEIFSCFPVEVEGDGNAFLDPGERGQLVVNYKNLGHAKALDLKAFVSVDFPGIRIVDEELDLDSLAVNARADLRFDIETANNIAIGVPIPVTCVLTDGAYRVEKTFNIEIGKVIENWETGDMTSFDWQTIGDISWKITKEESFEGEYSLRSGDIGAYEFTILDLDFTTVADDSVSFYRKVSSELNRNFLRFYIDREEMAVWSGEMDWERFSFYVSDGDHNCKWVYIKSHDGGDGQDCAWIDYIVFPQEQKTIAWAGLDFDACDGQTVQLHGRAAYYESVLWTTSGSGSFDDATILNPIYTPSAEDYSEGSLDFTLTVQGTEGDIKSHSQTASFETIPGIVDILNVPESIDVNETLSSDFECTEDYLADTYVWTIVPEEAGVADSKGQHVHIDWNENYEGQVTLSVYPENQCGAAEAVSKSFTLINSVGTVELDANVQLSIYPNPAADDIIVNYDSPESKLQYIEIFDVKGQLVYKTSKFDALTITKRLSLEKLSSGAYIMKFVCDKTVFNRSVVVN